MIESKNIEYKQRVTPELEKEVVAFLNANEGGFIYIGIDKTGKTIGVPPAGASLQLVPNSKFIICQFPSRQRGLDGKHFFVIYIFHKLFL